MDYEVELVHVDLISLDRNNPRHEPLRTENQAIRYLCDNENVLALARDVVDNGLNPLELTGLRPPRNDKYVAFEGNRRVCALKLLREPGRAPTPSLQRAFEKLATGWERIDDVPAIVVPDRNERRLWRERIHGGYAGGKGRRSWNAEQKTRHTGNTKNLAAQRLLDAGEGRGFITKAERKGTISTVQRYVSNPIFRHTLGLNTGQPDDPTTELDERDFDTLLKRFMEDVAARRVHTRHRKDDVVKYAKRLEQTEELSGERVEARPIREIAQSEEPTPSVPRPPKAPTRIRWSEELEAALRKTENFKLQKIYYSVCKLSLIQHTPLITVGLWVLLETLTALDGRRHDVSFPSYLSAQRLVQLGLGANRETRALREAVQRLSDSGNTTKHNQSAATFNGETLANDADTMGNLLIALATSAAAREEE